MYCTNCGNKLNENSDVCLHCGKYTTERKTIVEDSNNFIWGLVGFMCPIAGVILYSSWKNTKPQTAKKLALGAIIGAASNLISAMLSIIINLL